MTDLTNLTIVMHWHDWLALFGQYMLLSMLSISGAITYGAYAVLQK